MFGSLLNMRKYGFLPKVVIDVGAYRGEWTREVGNIFPDASFLLFEPQPDKSEILQQLARSASYPVTVHQVLLGAKHIAEVPYQLMETGSSVLPEKTSFPRETIKLPMRTLDECLGSETLAGPVFLKLDVQGYELEVLKGAESTLRKTDAILLEVALLEYNEGAPLLGDVVAFLKDRNFVVYDLCSFMRRETDQALFQIDLLFLRSDHPLREHKPFWLDEP